MLEDVYLNRYNYIWNRYLPKYHQSKSYQLGKILYRIKKENDKVDKAYGKCICDFTSLFSSLLSFRLR